MISGGTRSPFSAGVVSAGGVFGFWARRRDCGGAQVSLLGGVFSQFDLDAPSQGLVNSDFVIGLQVTYRRDRVSTRLRGYHLSSHLGDEFLLRNPSVERLDFGFQTLDGLVSLDEEWWRIYAGGGVRFFNHADLSPGVLRGGVEVGTHAQSGKRPHPVGAVDLSMLQAADWRPEISGAGGVEWSGLSNARRLRVLFVLFHGPAPYGQFFDQQTLRQAGLQLQFEF